MRSPSRSHGRLRVEVGGAVSSVRVRASSSRRVELLGPVEGALGVQGQGEVGQGRVEEALQPRRPPLTSSGQPGVATAAAATARPRLGVVEQVADRGVGGQRRRAGATGSATSQVVRAVRRPAPARPCRARARWRCCRPGPPRSGEQAARRGAPRPPRRRRTAVGAGPRRRSDRRRAAAGRAISR